MVTTVKFSEFPDAPLVDDDLSSVGLENGVNVITSKYPTWQTVSRPATPFVALMGYNTDLQSYEFWDGLQWTQLEDSTDIVVLLALLASHLAGEGASLIGLENQGSVSNKTVQDFNEAAFIAKTDNGTLPNGQFLSALATGFMSSTTITGVVATRLLVATANQIDITNVDGSGNPAFSLSSTLDFPGTFTVQTSTVIDEIIDDDTMATATDSNIPTSESVVAYIASVVGGAAGGVPGNIQYNNAGGFGGDANFNTDGAGNIDIVGSLDVDNININGNTLSSTNANGDINLTPNGVGQVLVPAPTTGSAATTKTYVDNLVALYLPLAGGTMSGAINMGSNLINALLDPVSAQDAATKAYVDAIAAAFNTVFVARLASTVALTATYANGSSGVGATLTNAGAQVALTLDGVAAVVGNLVLIKNQASTLQNGYYVVTNIGSGATNWVLTRSTAYDTPTEIQPGDLFIITAGSTQSNTSWIQTATVTAVGVDAITFTQYSVSLPIPVTQGGTGLTSTTINEILYSSANNVIAGLPTANNGVLITSAGGVPSIGSTLPTAVQDNITNLGAMAEALNMNSHLINNVTDPVSAQDAATKAYVDANTGSVGLLSNMLFNSTFVVHQRGSAFTAAGTYPNNDGVYLLDGWVHLSDGNDITDINQALTGIPTAWGGNRCEYLIATANKQFGAVQFVESLTPQSPIFQTSTFTALIAANLPGVHVTIDNIRFAIIEWTGAVNAVTRDPISAWASGATLPTLAANWAYVASHAEITLDSTFRFWKISGTTSASANNIAFLWWCSDANATLNDQLAIEGCWLFTGDITNTLPADGTATNSMPDNFLPTVTVGLELRAAQRYFQKTFDQGTAPASSAGFVGSVSYTCYRAGANNNFILRPFPVVMRAAPTVTSFNPGAAGTAWRNDSATANSGAFNTQYIGDSSVTLFNPQVAGDALSQVIAVQLTMSAEL